MEITKLIHEADQSISSHNEQFAVDVLMGLCSNPKSISAKYFYDDIGSDYFQKITKHDDYYLTDSEFEILNSIKNIIPTHFDEDEIDIVELGAGDGHKTKLIIDGFLKANKKVNFYPIDISGEAMVQLEKNIDVHENLIIHGVVAEYMDGLKFVRKKSKNKQFVLFLGSNIGNFNRVQNQGFLRQLWKNLNHGDNAFIGFDLKKNVQVLNQAYNDSDGLTRGFNLNLLTRINKVLGGEFDLNSFEHFGSYNPVLGAMESFLLSTKHQEVYISELQRSFSFEAYEPIHLEYSFKFTEHEIDNLGNTTGFEVIKHFKDSKNYFVDSFWKVTKS